VRYAFGRREKKWVWIFWGDFVWKRKKEKRKKRKENGKEKEKENGEGNKKVKERNGKWEISG